LSEAEISLAFEAPADEQNVPYSEYFAVQKTLFIRLLEIKKILSS